MGKNIGIIGYGSMGKMLLDKFSQDKVVNSQALLHLCLMWSASQQ